MKCPRCQHENRPQAKFCEECGGPCKGASPTAVAYADPKSEEARPELMITHEPGIMFLTDLPRAGDLPG